MPIISGVNLKINDGYGSILLAISSVIGISIIINRGMFIDNQKINESNAYKWQKNISHVPQNIFIADATIKENIALGFAIESIDDNLIKNVIKQAQLSDLVSRLSHGLDTNIGERGIKLSGGERQRIGIARALYRKPRLIIFDEATSALDSATEHSVMSAINKLSSDLTILIVAHRIGTLKNCDQIIELKNGKIFKKYNYAQLTKGLKERQ
jgi:ATP-binding cassette subfamily B protein